MLKLHLMMVAVAHAGKSLSSALTYLESIQAVVRDEYQSINDNSTGIVWFNTSGTGLENFSFPLIGDFGIESLSSFNYLDSISKLANHALEQEMYGDAVFLLYKYLYAGKSTPTKLNIYSDMVKDMINDMVGSSAKREDLGELLQMLNETVSAPELGELYTLVSEPPPQVDIEKRDSVKCLGNHQANRYSCWKLVARIQNDRSRASGSPRHIEYDGCFISWSEDAALLVRDLAPNAIWCLHECTDVGISCEVAASRFLHPRFRQCLSNRGRGCGGLVRGWKV